jgi:hypothetical protein
MTERVVLSAYTRSKSAAYLPAALVASRVAMLPDRAA